MVGSLNIRKTMFSLVTWKLVFVVEHKMPKGSAGSGVRRQLPKRYARVGKGETLRHGRLNLLLPGSRQAVESGQGTYHLLNAISLSTMFY